MTDLYKILNTFVAIIRNDAKSKATCQAYNLEECLFSICLITFILKIYLCIHDGIAKELCASFACQWQQQILKDQVGMFCDDH